MKTNWMFGTAMMTMIVAGTGLQAQSGKTNDKESITVTGCLQPSDRAAVGTSGSDASRSADSGRTASGDAAGRSFMLVNARVGNAPGGGSAVTSIAPPGSGTTESAARAGTTQPSAAITGATSKNGEPDESATRTFALTGNYPELPRHAGQEVEISGRLVSSGAAAGTAGASSASTGSTASNSSANAARPGSAQTLEVQTLRMIASVCAGR